MVASVFCVEHLKALKFAPSFSLFQTLVTRSQQKGGSNSVCSALLKVAINRCNAKLELHLPHALHLPICTFVMLPCSSLGVWYRSLGLGFAAYVSVLVSYIWSCFQHCCARQGAVW